MTASRNSGLLLHPSSLPGGHGIGDLGPAAREFVAQLALAGQSLWQILPLAPTSAGNSPYSALSTFAGNPLLISFDDLRDEGLADAEILSRLPADVPGHVNFGEVITGKLAALDTVCAAILRRSTDDDLLSDFELFCARHDRDWLDEYALFMVLKAQHGGRAWSDWTLPYASREPMALAQARQTLDNDIRRIKVQQFLFFRQWQRLRQHAHANGVRIVGDMPIFVAGDSADVWSRRDLFELDAAGRATLVAGVPPDYFSATGQLWGNPLYRWSAHDAEGFAWWKLRMAKTLEQVDLVRIDHFRGFESYWEIPAGELTAERGRWVEAPGRALFQALRDAFGTLPVIAEDLGTIDHKVEELRDHFDFPGMRVLPFEWGEEFQPERSDSSRHSENRVFYTGTHDNDTIIGWLNSLGGPDSERGQRILAFLHSDRSAPHWGFIRYAYETNARSVIVPVQDVLGLGSEARMNTPGLAEGNWAWRLRPDQLTADDLQRLRQMTADTGRLAGRAV